MTFVIFPHMHQSSAPVFTQEAHPKLGRGIQQVKIPVKVKDANISVHAYSWQEPDRILMKSEFQHMCERGSTD